MKEKIFVVEDDALTATLIQQYIEEMGYQCVGVSDSAEAALVQIKQCEPDLVLMDIRLSGKMDGIEAAAKLQADSTVAVIYVTAYADDPLLARAKLTEPFGYVVKPFSRQDLRASIETGLYKSKIEGQVHQLAFYDELTQLPNRRLLIDRLKHAMAACKRNGRYAALLFLDLDNFKPLNDRRGHEAGDLLLVKVARRIKTCVREIDTVSRFGGDEFVVLLSDLVADEAESTSQAGFVAEKIRSKLAEPYSISVKTEAQGDETVEHRCTASIGAVVFSNHETSHEDILKSADAAMYQAKEVGRNRVRFFDPDVQTQVIGRAALKNDLRHALDLRQFKLYYQPQVNLQGQIVAAEALLRWQHPERGLVAPDKFLALAEETDLIVPIGQWVLQTACAQLKAWEGKPLTRNLHLAVNVSEHQYRQAGFLESVQQALSDSAIHAEQLKLEVTESMMLDVPDAIGKMKAIKTLGVGFSMDDFGTGYSSLASLTKLPLSELKIDQSFVRTLGVESSSAIVVQTAIAMGQALALEVIAEGVETQAQRDLLAQQGGQRFQGYLFSRPVPIEEFEALLQ